MPTESRFDRSSPRVAIPLAEAGAGVTVPDNDTLETYHELQGSNYGLAFYDANSSTCGSAAAFVVKTIDAMIERLAGYFRVDPDKVPGPWRWQFFMVPGGGGAVHFGCLNKILFVGADTATPFSGSLALMLTVAEAVEVFEAGGAAPGEWPPTGWYCNDSAGEGLSRALAEEMFGSNPIHPGFLVANVWLNGGRPNFVDSTAFTDRDSIANGCSVLFLNWLRFSLFFSWRDIIDSMAGSGGALAFVYQRLTGKTTAWVDFSKTLDSLIPASTTASLVNNNPFIHAPVSLAQVMPAHGIDPRKGIRGRIPRVGFTNSVRAALKAWSNPHS
jgi:hypothetical protein